MHRKLLSLFIAVLFLAQSVKGVQYAFQVNFSNKTGSPGFSDSLDFLAVRSLLRRSVQHINLDSTDLPVNRAYIDSVLRTAGGKFHLASKWFNCCVILVRDSSQMHNLHAINFVRNYKLVGYYSDSLHRAAAPLPSVKDEKLYSGKTTAWDAVYYGQTWNQTIQVNGNYLHSIGYEGVGKLIAVIDAGFVGTDTHAGFAHLYSSGRVLDVYNFVKASANVYAYDQHGTQVLSTIGGYVPNAFVGSAPKSSFALYVTEDVTEQPIELINFVCAAERADSLGADIISSSLGYNYFDNSADNLSYTDLDGKTTIAAKAVNIGTTKGMLFVITAGNDGLSSWHNILTPGDADSALTIGNVDLSGNNAPNSGYGPNAAGRVKPDVCALGEPGAVFNYMGGYSTASGTSISTPEVAGWAACLWQAAPSATPYQIKRAIIECASRYSSPGAQIGYGIPNLHCSANALDITDTPGPFIAGNITITNPNFGSVDLHITLDDPTTIDFQLFDVNGKLTGSFSGQYERGVNPVETLDISLLPAGWYLLRATSARFISNLKLLKL